MRRPRREESQSRGFTLVEFVLVGVIAIVVGVMVVMVSLSLSRGLTILSVRSLVSGRMRATAEWFEREIHAAQAIEATYTDTGGTAHTTSFTVVILRLPSINPVSPTDVDRVIYRLNGARLERTIDAAPGTGRVAQCGGAGLCPKTRTLVGGDGVLSVTTLRFSTDAAGTSAPQPSTRRIVAAFGVSGTLQGFGDTQNLTVTYRLRSN